MEITDEIKFSALAPYYNQYLAYGGDNEHPDRVGYMLNQIEEGYSHGSKFEYWKVKLKPLSAISDEDAIEVAKIFGVKYKIRRSDVNPCLFKVHGTYETIMFDSNSVVFDDGNGETGCTAESLFVYQYLQSKGYDLPNYHLGGKTLFEAGLCIY